jgi:hypothetical protein
MDEEIILLEEHHIQNLLLVDSHLFRIRMEDIHRHVVVEMIDIGTDILLVIRDEIDLVDLPELFIIDSDAEAYPEGSAADACHLPPRNSDPKRTWVEEPG